MASNSDSRFCRRPAAGASALLYGRTAGRKRWRELSKEGWHVHRLYSVPTTRTRVRTVPTIWSTVLAWPDLACSVELSGAWTRCSRPAAAEDGAKFRLGRGCQVLWKAERVRVDVCVFPQGGVQQLGPKLRSSWVSCRRFRRLAQRAHKEMAYSVI